MLLRKKTAESLTHILHQATVRRHVVLTLIQTAVNRNHPAYQHLDMEQVLMKASELARKRHTPRNHINTAHTTTT